MNYEVPILVDENEETPNNLKTCLICDTQVIHLTKHMKVHNKDYSEQCYICDKTFTLKSISKFIWKHMTLKKLMMKKVSLKLILIPTTLIKC